MNDSNKWQILLRSRVRCPLNYLCGCKVSHKLFYTKDKVVLKASEVKSWCRRKMQDAEINFEIDSILEQSLKDAAYYAEHVTKTNATDRAYWKVATVSKIFFLTYSIYRHLISCSLCNRGIRV